MRICIKEIEESLEQISRLEAETDKVNAFDIFETEDVV